MALEIDVSQNRDNPFAPIPFKPVSSSTYDGGVKILENKIQTTASRSLWDILCSFKEATLIHRNVNWQQAMLIANFLLTLAKFIQLHKVQIGALSYWGWAAMTNIAQTTRY